MAHDTFQIGDLTAVIGDNEAWGEHRAGYNGIQHLVHRTNPVPLFVPGIAGLNLEHIFDGDRGLGGLPADREVFFEPRRAPMEFRKISESEAELHQPPTPQSHLESWTRFRLVPPHSIDFSFQAKPMQHAFRHGYIGLFWASYLNGPEDKSMYLRGGRRWLQLCTAEHNDRSTALHRDDRLELVFTAGSTNALYKNFSALRWDEPFFYGNFAGHQLILMFERAEGLRFTHSPSGGGDHGERETTNPAWDFQWIIPRYQVLEEYGFKARLAYRERAPRAEILKEVETWRKGGGR